MNIYDPPLMYQDLIVWERYLIELGSAETNREEAARVRAIIDRKRKEKVKELNY